MNRENLDYPVCVIDPVMRGLRVNLNTVTGIQTVLTAVKIDGQDAFQYIDEFFSVMAVHFQTIIACMGGGHQMEYAGKACKVLRISIYEILNNLGIYLKSCG